MSELALIYLAISAACAGLFIVASMRAGRPADPLRPRWLPWRAITVCAGAGGLLAIAQFVSLVAPDLRAAALQH